VHGKESRGLRVNKTRLSGTMASSAHCPACLDLNYSFTNHGCGIVSLNRDGTPLCYVMVSTELTDRCEKQ
jgi:hypothetical protein